MDRISKRINNKRNYRMIKLIIACLAVLGVYFGASLWFPSLQNKALILGNYDITGTEVVAVFTFFVALFKN
jgi:hypothetical protein